MQRSFFLMESTSEPLQDNFSDSATQGNRATARTQNVYLEGGYQYQVGDRFWATAGLEMNLIETPYASRRYVTPTFGFRMAF